MSHPSKSVRLASIFDIKKYIGISYAGIVVLSLFTIIGVIAICLCDTSTLAILSSDDSFYYFLTARNFVLGNGMSFDGINATNGFHPLWMLILFPIYSVTGGEYDLSLRLIYLLLLCLYSGSIALTYILLKSCFGRISALLSLLLFLNPIIFNLFFNGLESALEIFLLLLVLNVGRRTDLVSPRMNLRNQALAGILFGLVFMSRLDCAFHLMALAGVALIVYRLPIWNPMALPSLIRSYGLVFIAFALVVTPYFTWNLVANGHLSPISGALKSSFPYPEARLRALLAVSRAPYTLFIVISVVIGLIQLSYSGSPLRRLIASRGEGHAWTVLLTALWLGSLVHYGYTLFFTTWGTHQWHFASYVPLILICAAWVFAKLSNGNRFVAYGMALLVISISGGMLFFSVRLKAKQHGNWDLAADWARNYTAPGSVFGMTDAGYFAYFSRRNTVNLDGLINGYEYQEALTGNTLDEYFERCGIDYICDYEVRASKVGVHRIMLNRIFLSEMRNGKRGYEVAFPMDQTIYKSPPYAPYSLKEELSENDKIVFCIWPYDKGRLTPLPTTPIWTPR